MRSTLRVSAVAAAILSLTAMSANAQSANISATATVFQAITVTGARNLAFGNVFPGVNRSIPVTDANSGRFDLAGQAGANVNLTFTLPPTLDSGANTLAIGTWSGYVNGTNSAVAGGAAFVPSATAQPAAFSAGGQLFVFVGATVAPTAAQAAGTYSGIVTLTAAYF
jgi:hypothetical protein